MSRIALVFSGSALTPSWPNRWPRNFTEDCLKAHFSWLSVTPTVSCLWRTRISLVSCSASFLPTTNTLSIRQVTPSKPSRIAFILLWNSSGALEMLKGSLLKWYLPNGVMKRVSGWDSGDNGICQNLLLASSLLKMVTPVSCASASSTLGIGCTSRNMLSLSGFRSTDSHCSCFLWDNHHASTPGSGVFHFQDHSQGFHLAELILHLIP